MAKKKTKKAVLTPKELKEFEALLLAKRQEIMGNVVSIENDTLRKEHTDLSHMPMHMGDMGSDTFEVDNSLSLVDGERKLMTEIDQALDRIENGTYGICLGNGEPIGKPRLTAIPWTKYCIEFATQLEKGLVQRPEESYPDLPDKDGDRDEDAA